MKPPLLQPEIEVLEVLQANADNRGVAQVSVATVTEKLSIGRTAAKKRLSALQAKGYIEQLSRGCRRSGASEYRLVNNLDLKGSRIPYGITTTITTALTREIAEDIDTQVICDPFRSAAATSSGRWTQVRSEPPLATGERLNLFSPEVGQLVGWFEYLIHPFAKYGPTPKRRTAWVCSAAWLLVYRRIPMAELVELLSWLFFEHNGIMPIHTEMASDRKVTRLEQVSHYYADLKEAMLQDVHPLGQETPRPQLNYMYPLPDADLEAKAVDLAERFEKYRAADQSRMLSVASYQRKDFDFRGWCKTARIMLHRDGRTFGEVADLLDGMFDCLGELEAGKFMALFWVRNDYDHLSAELPMLRQVAQARQTPQLPPESTEQASQALVPRAAWRSELETGDQDRDNHAIPMELPLAWEMVFQITE